MYEKKVEITSLQLFMLFAVTRIDLHKVIRGIPPVPLRFICMQEHYSFGSGRLVRYHLKWSTERYCWFQILGSLKIKSKEAGSGCLITFRCVSICMHAGRAEHTAIDACWT